MKRMSRILVFSLVFAAGLSLAASGTGFAAIVAQWNYNDQNATVDVDNAVGTPTNTAVSPATLSYSRPGNGSNTDPTDPASSTSDYALRMTWGTPQTGSGAKWAVSTAGYTDITVTLDLVRSMSGTASPLSYIWGYSTDGGTTWTNTSFTVSDNEDWNNLSYNLSSIAGANNNANFQFHILANESTRTQYAYVDYVTFNGTSAPVPLPAAAWLFASGILGLVGLRRRKK